MEDHTSGPTVSQPSFVDLIDYPVSDLYRDHYAAQGLTYYSGRRADRKSEHHRGSASSKVLVAHAAHENFSETALSDPLAQAITELTAELRCWRRNGGQRVTTEHGTEKSNNAFNVVCKMRT